MKKKIGYLFIAIGIVIIALYLFRYKRPLMIENKVPITATEVVQIDLRQIEHHLLVDAIKNPFKYISLKSDNKEHTSFKKTVVIPRNLLFFTNKSSFKGAWFSSFIELKDYAKLRSYLLQEGFKELTDKKLKLFDKDKIIIAVSNENVIIVYKTQRDISVKLPIQAVFDEANFHKKENDLLKSISNSQSDITYASLDADFLEADFKKGAFEIKGKLYSDLFITDTYSEYSENLIGCFKAKINRDHSVFKSFISDKSKSKFREFTKLSLDSIVDHWNGRVSLNLKAIDKKIDTIVTYEYDDDFNKIEKKSVQELNIPNVVMVLGSNGSLYEYFHNNKAIQIVENDTLLTAMPLYKMYARSHGNYLNVFTQKEFSNSLLKEKKYKLNVHLNINRYLENPLEFSLIPIKNDYLQLLKKASVQLTTNDELLIQVKLKESSRNFLGQFVKP